MILGKFIIVNADDFGLSRGVTKGILQAHINGLVTSTTVMMNQFYTEEALREIEYFPELSVGVHLVVNKGIPVSSINLVKSLVDESGYFLKDTFDVRHLLISEELFTEFCAQIDKFIKITKKKPSHIDCHHWSILYPDFFRTYLKVAQKYNIPARNPLFNFKHNSEIVPLLLGPFHQLISDEYVFSIKRKLSNSKVPHPDYFVASFYDSNVSINYLRNIFMNIKEGVTEIMTHPGYVDDTLNSSYVNQREYELEILTSPILKKVIEDNKIQLVNYNYLVSQKLEV
ncbi:ChbG/HpnK family deacetylase [Paenibacillus polymyxa]|uniref:carbohydrate deacetylase n=1 Tax=Paenibacillus polymyxa TaxID=1406 RepID=UPI002AB5A94D|nr:ChbG/HpnK family deacetylase [Paenibacillus polymyxa]MDY7989858.1 ChbG/HpnK family deacetylase [Paenibacillus polymyxa]MDY8116783.1 ChbG/HpnK family deacetylase [Paenibacillus polymyxa]